MLLADFGAGALLAALALGVFATLLGFLSGARGLPLQALVARRALWAASGAVVIASLVLEAAFLSHDFVIAYVAEHSDLATPPPLLAAAFYGGQEGSLLYWTLVLAVIGGLSLAGTGPVACPPTRPASSAPSSASSSSSSTSSPARSSCSASSPPTGPDSTRCSATAGC